MSLTFKKGIKHLQARGPMAVLGPEKRFYGGLWCNLNVFTGLTESLPAVVVMDE